jgi:hypothetical protein
VLPQPCFASHHLADIVNSRGAADFEKCTFCGGSILTLDGLAEEGGGEGGRVDWEGLCICKFAEAARSGVVCQDLDGRQATLMRSVSLHESMRAKVSLASTRTYTTRTDSLRHACMHTHIHIHDETLHILPLPRPNHKGLLVP